MTTSTPARATDPRPLHLDALAWVSALATAVGPARLADPTPCDEFDVRTLLAHLVTTVRRPAALVAGTDPAAPPHVSSDVLDDPVTAYVTEAAALREALRGPRGDACLERVARLPFGEVTGRVALWAYLNETLVHGWDLAVATGQDPEADPELAAAALPAARELLPAEPRGGPIPFAPAVTPRTGAGPTEQLANWSGRER